MVVCKCEIQIANQTRIISINTQIASIQQMSSVFYGILFGMHGIWKRTAINHKYFVWKQLIWIFGWKCFVSVSLRETDWIGGDFMLGLAHAMQYDSSPKRQPQFLIELIVRVLMNFAADMYAFISQWAGRAFSNLHTKCDYNVHENYCGLTCKIYSFIVT